MQTNIKSIFSSVILLIALCTGVFAQDKAALTPANTIPNQVTSQVKVRAEYTPANIEKAQQILKDKGLYKGEITGKVDSQTKEAIKAYQQQNGLNPTGHLNKDTRQKLGIETATNSDKFSNFKKVKVTK
jgi:peptidoglycan hydrolase-like protein with peptidoglycan-binding domain